MGYQVPEIVAVMKCRDHNELIFIITLSKRHESHTIIAHNGLLKARFTRQQDFISKLSTKAFSKKVH